MNFTKMTLAAASLLIMTGAPSLADWSVPAMNKQIDQTNFVVNDGCSGTLVSLKDKLILTAAHCADGMYKVVSQETVADDGTITKKDVKIKVPGEVKQLFFDDKADVIKSITYLVEPVKVGSPDTDAGPDLAVLKITSAIENTQAASVACADPVRGDDAYIVGNPMGTLYSSVVKGIVSSTLRTYNIIGFPKDARLMQVSGGIIGGNSGGAVYNKDGQLIGVPVLGNRTNEVVGLAVPRKEVVDFLKAAGFDACPVLDDKKDNR